MIAYVDTSAILAIEFNQVGAPQVAERINEASSLIASNLVEAETLSAIARERRASAPELISQLVWINPDRSLKPEFDLVLEAGYLKGADLWHVAVALFASPDASQTSFITLDIRQREVARKVGFQT